MRRQTVYTWKTGKLSHPMRLLVVSDLHDAEYRDLLPLLPDADALLMPGDAVNRYRQTFHNAIAFIGQAADTLPTFVGVGNHELRLETFVEFRDAVTRTGAVFLQNEYARLDELVIGCWYRPENYGQRDMLPAMEAEDGAKILMCHRPEDYMHRLRGARVDVVLAGHAHGGQIRFGNRGLYAPGQGLLPKYTRGVVDERMIVSAGASNNVFIPRINNPCEVLWLLLD